MPRAAWLCQAFWHKLHAEVSIAAHNREGRKGLERRCCYLSRLPIPQDRLERRGDGKFVLSLKRTWKGGVKAVVFEPIALIAQTPRGAPACTLPGAPTLSWRLCTGPAAPNSNDPRRVRSAIVPTPPGLPPSPRCGVPVAPKRPGRMNWADLLMRV